MIGDTEMEPAPYSTTITDGDQAKRYSLFRPSYPQVNLFHASIAHCTGLYFCRVAGEVRTSQCIDHAGTSLAG